MSSPSGRTQTRRSAWIIMMLWLVIVGALPVTAAVTTGNSEGSGNCERLKATLTYTQEKAPRDLSSVLPVVVEKVNRVLDGVVDVEVEWTGAELHGRVGEHYVKSTVTRLATAVAAASDVTVDEYGREVTKQCFHVPFTILDTNECTLPAEHPMKDKCGEPSICVNTIGSYDCVCPYLAENQSHAPSITPGSTVDDDFWKLLDSTPRSPWELSFSTRAQSSCVSASSTHGCCAEQAHGLEGSKCRQRFQCPVDPCKTASNDCASTAECIRAETPTQIPSHTCQCPAGLMGNGRACKPSDPMPQPKVMFDGKTPTELTLKNNYYCGCTKPVVDACSGFPKCEGKHEICTVGAGNKPKCACKEGYVFHEKYGCVDQNPPTLKLRHDPKGDKTLRLKQGDEYREYMVDIVDDNAEDYLRSLKVSYSKPLPPGCLTQIGNFHVNYTVAMPWAKVPYVRETRQVLIEDINECTLDATEYLRTCPSLVPQCDTNSGAKCSNTNGSYECKCPSYSTGDGFLKSANFGEYPAPPTFEGGTGCTDTSKPVITLQGPNPKTFKICECGGLSGVMGGKNNEGDSTKELQVGQRSMYGGDIKEMIRATAGAELCATPANPHPKPADCVKAVDRTYKGDIDLSERVVVGEPVQKSALEWDVPYNVKDDAGNEAVTVWRHVVVQEVDLNSVEALVRAEVEKEKEAQIKTAIDNAIKKEKAKWEREQVTSRRKASATSCPACPKCDCPDTPETNMETCQSYCENVSKSCALSDSSMMYSIIFWLENYLSPAVIPIVAIVVFLFGSFMVLRFILTAIYNPDAYRGRGYENVGTTEEESIYRGMEPKRSPGPPSQSLISHASSNPLASNANRRSNGMDSSQIRLGYTANANFGSPPPSFASPRVDPSQATPRSPGLIESKYGESSYMTSPVITPSRTGDGVQRRNLYSS